MVFNTRPDQILYIIYRTWYERNINIGCFWKYSHPVRMIWKKHQNCFNPSLVSQDKIISVFQTKMRDKTKYDIIEEIPLEELESQVRVEGQFHIDCHVPIILRWLKIRSIQFFFNFRSNDPSCVRTLRWLVFFSWKFWDG